ncbi:MAG: precorrin-6A reductase [Phascolarctobacterium sp.]|nr:precorrin-6A reductase [Phascolarctobacterium sp.]
MKQVVWLIGGTSEGRNLIKGLATADIELYVSVATDYGAALIEEQANTSVMANRLDLNSMRAFIRDKKPVCVIDATHPYATIVTETVQEACKLENAEYIRLVRPSAEKGDYVLVSDFAEAVDLLNQLEGNIFLTTGSKNLPDFTGVNNFAERIALRVLPMENSLKTALTLGYAPKNIVCMQGPFSEELDIAMFKKFNARYIVTKDSGAVGGFDEKVRAAKACDAKLIVVGRKSEEEGICFAEVLTYLQTRFC